MKDLVTPLLIPNSQRDNFNENETRVFFEREIKAYCYDTLHKIYNAAAKLKSNYKRLEEYSSAVDELDTKKKTGFVDEKEKADLERRVSEAQQRKDEAQKAIEKIPSETADSPDLIYLHTMKK